MTDDEGKIVAFRKDADLAEPSEDKFLVEEGLDLLANFRKLPPDLRKRITDLIRAMLVSIGGKA